MDSTVYRSIVLVEYVGEEDVYDLTVPFCHNYSAHGIWNHNSEAWDVLHKIAPEVYGSETRDAFLRKYNRGTLASGVALQREMAPYIYTANVDTGVTHDRMLHHGEEMRLTPGQQTEYSRVEGAFARARQARRRKDGQALVKELQVLNPRAFENGMPDQGTIDRMGRSLGTLKEAALNRVVNLDPNGVKVNWVKAQLQRSKGRPTLIFAHNLAAVDTIAEQLKADGHSVGVLKGSMSGDAKNAAKEAFAGSNPTTDILVSSDAGAMGANMQRGSQLINYDSPMTSMLHAQRLAREIRTGQQNHVLVHDLVADAEFDRRARRRLERKYELRDLMTTPAELIDDSGAAARIEKARAKSYDDFTARRAAA